MMKPTLKLLAFVSVLIFMSGCASIYKPINPNYYSYYYNQSDNNLEFSYRYDVLKYSGNKKYAKKAAKKGVKVVAVKLTNHYDHTISVGRDVDFYLGENKVDLLNPGLVKNTIKQNVAGYLPYLLLTSLKLYLTNVETNEVKTLNVGYLLGPGLTVGNMAAASSSNDKLFENLSEFDVYNKELKPGETMHALIAFQSFYDKALSVRLKAK